MRITILGATGRVGGRLMEYALKDGHEVTLLVRSPEKLSSPLERLTAEEDHGAFDKENALHHAAFIKGNGLDRVTIIQGSVLDEAALNEAVKDADAVVSAIGTDGGTTLSVAMPLLIEAMQAHNVSRLIAIGTAGVLESRAEPGLLRYQSSESRRTLTRAAEEHHVMLQAIEQSDLDWTLVCPTYLPDGEYTGIYRTEKDYLPIDGKQISVADTADFAYRQLGSAEFVRSRVGIAY
ncbi:NAD(P)-dependent oxidoreductase [Paenibacillus radicis (ex Gao et al. 2016)]|uniref:Oxidoreductase n=1 Tax=Paenibacillus radicis (ex Gao et al. 2016) TaxID=1737354 RepID=A0A917M2Q9_9BACL|nr:SDR family oxidoreductase [Paenibacillus radicis (ex Gao et al. 2016)]GGG73252.1 oxidoreductase [Paenibacillus radicis (ex Gao et al. 2016)]